MALVRDSWQNRGPNFTHFGILIRCVKGNHTSFLHTLHYLTTRRIIFSFTLKKEQFFVPILYVLRVSKSDFHLKGRGTIRRMMLLILRRADALLWRGRQVFRRVLDVILIKGAFVTMGQVDSIDSQVHLCWPEDSHMLIAHYNEEI